MTLPPGVMDGAMFTGYVEQQLPATLAPGDSVICDNLSGHKVPGVRKGIESAGAQLLYLPAYSPDLNPIGMAFSKLKSLLRKIAARTWDELLHCLDRVLQDFSPQGCQNHFQHRLQVK